MIEFVATIGPAGLADLVVRATILLGVSLILQWWIRMWPAVTRHRLWTLTFVLLLALPALRQFGPAWDLPLLPGSQRPSDAVVPLEVGRLAEAESGVETPWRSALVIDGGATGEARKAYMPGRWIRSALLIWAVGSAVAFASLGVGAWRFSKLVRAGQAVEDETWLSELGALRRRLCIRAKVRLVLTEEAVTPMTGGIRRPVILLPISATDWSKARRHAVMAHELVHVRRRDAFRQLLGRFALAVYWFHPLSWVASHLATARREEACDEEVLAAGARPSEYAGHLLSLAESGSPRRPALSLAMAQHSQLERRVRAILRPGRPCPRTLVPAVALVAAAVGGVSVSIANPTRPERVPRAVEEAAGFDAAALHCVPASDAEELSGWEFAQGLGEMLVCTIQGESGETAGNGAGTIGLVGWEALESEIRRQLEQEGVAPR